MNKRIVIEFDARGRVKVQTHGFKGQGCVEATQTLELRAFSNETMGAGQTFRRARFGQGSAGWVAANRLPMRADDATKSRSQRSRRNLSISTLVLPTAPTRCPAAATAPRQGRASG